MRMASPSQESTNLLLAAAAFALALTNTLRILHAADASQSNVESLLLEHSPYFSPSTWSL